MNQNLEEINMKKIISLIAAIGLTTSMYANDNTGCGLGSLVIKDQSTVMLQVLAATTNGTSGSQTLESQVEHQIVINHLILLQMTN